MFIWKFFRNTIGQIYYRNFIRVIHTYVTCFEKRISNHEVNTTTIYTIIFLLYFPRRDIVESMWCCDIDMTIRRKRLRNVCRLALGGIWIRSNVSLSILLEPTLFSYTKMWNQRKIIILLYLLWMFSEKKKKYYIYNLDTRTCQIRFRIESISMHYYIIIISLKVFEKKTNTYDDERRGDPLRPLPREHIVHQTRR